MTKEASKKDIKKIAKKLKKEKNLSHSDARKEALKILGFKDEHHASKVLQKENPADAKPSTWGVPAFNIGSYGSLKAKALLKEAILTKDASSLENLPAYEGEDQTLSLEEKIRKRRIKLGDHLSKEMTKAASLSRLYLNEKDYFYGSVYGVVPEYWIKSVTPPTGSKEVADYLKKNPQVEKAILEMLDTKKNQVCGREVFERLPIRPDKEGSISDMKIDENFVLKFDLFTTEERNRIFDAMKPLMELYKGEFNLEKAPPVKALDFDKEVQNYLKESGLDISLETLKEVKKAYPKMYRELKKNQMDTGYRDWLWDSIAEFVGMKEPWPIGETPKKALDDFFESFRELCQSKGMKYN